MFPDDHYALRSRFGSRRRFDRIGDRLVRLVSAIAVRRVRRWQTEIAPLVAPTRPAIRDVGEY